MHKFRGCSGAHRPQFDHGQGQPRRRSQSARPHFRHRCQQYHAQSLRLRTHRSQLGGSDIPNDKGTASWTFFNSADGATGDGTAALAHGGLSSITAYGNNVPEAGTTLGLAGLSLIAVGLFARRRQIA